MKAMKLGVAILLGPLLLSAPPALGADAALEEARALTGQATVEYNLGRFEQALDLYTKAYERYSKAALLFNIGQCHRLLGHYEKALFFYHGYLREQPDAPNRALAERHIEESQRALDAQRSAQEAESQRRAAHDAESVPAEASSAPAPAPVATPVGPSREAPEVVRSSPTLRIAGLATAGAGVVMLGTGVAFGLHASSVSNELQRLSSLHGTWSAQYQSDYDSGKSAATAATVFYILGATALAGGAVLTWLGWPKAHAVTTAFAPLPGGGSVAVAGRF
jgi:tetratricopeptide (TPR) repeat protein